MEALEAEDREEDDDEVEEEDGSREEKVEAHCFTRRE